MIAIGNYIFAGGFTLGVEKYFDVLAHLEEGPFGTKTAQTHWPDLYIETDPANWVAAAKAVMGRKSRRLDLLYCNPPCAAWSKAGKFTWLGKGAYMDSPHHTSCTDRAAALALELRPRIWVWESVPQAFEHGRPFVDALAKKFMDAGCHVLIFFSDCQLHGVPQRRPRFHFIAHEGKMPEWIFDFEPKDPGTTLPFLKKAKIKRHTIKPIADFLIPHIDEMKKAGRYGSLRQFMDENLGGEHAYATRQTSTGKVYRVGRPSFQVKHVRPDGLCETFTGGPMKIHPIETRFLSVEEQQVLGGWPLSFKFQGTVNNQYAEVAKAVQPITAEFVAKFLADFAPEKRKKPRRYMLLDLRPLIKKGGTIVYKDLPL